MLCVRLISQHPVQEQEPKPAVLTIRRGVALLLPHGGLLNYVSIYGSNH